MNPTDPTPTDPISAVPATDLLVQSRALGDGTRHAIFALLRDAPTPLTVAELTAHFGLNHNAIRQHLAKLVDADLVVSERDRTPATGAGRPPMRYRAVPGAGERLGGSGPFEALAALLVQLLKGEGTPREIGHRAGLALAAEHASAGDAVAVLESVARRLGFEPRVEPTSDRTDVVLDRCPFAGPATDAPEIVCELHLGIAEGIAEAAPDDAAIAGLDIRPPDRAGCRIAVVPAAPTS